MASPDRIPALSSWPHDVLHEFFAVLLGVWASFVLTTQDFSLLYAVAVLFVTVVPIYRLAHAFASVPQPLLVRWFGYGTTLVGVALAVPAIAWFSVVLIHDATARPPAAQIAFLGIIVFFWILAVEAGYLRQGLNEEERIWARK